ncbi:MAG TPA: DUF2062 domain-containing protein [Verrucomicrobiota bacterium]|nr:DUF2062 domain-containing protein [Verrucomicrobiota bacterium]
MKQTFRQWSRGARLRVLQFFRLRAATERVARGFALGVVVNFFPTFGFGVLVSGALARTLGGNVVAGFMGGALLTFFWPALFFLNLKVGSFLLSKRSPVEQVADVPEVAAKVVWGQSFTVGAVVNTLVIGTAVYLIVWALYGRIRPLALRLLRREDTRRVPQAPVVSAPAPRRGHVRAPGRD